MLPLLPSFKKGLQRLWVGSEVRRHISYLFMRLTFSDKWLLTGEE